MSPLLRIFLNICFFLSLAAPLWANESAYSDSTLVVYNKNFPDSESLAKFYLAERSIPSENLVGLSCATTEEITREDFRATIETPLRDHFTKAGLWEVESGSDGLKRATSNKIHIMVLVRGMPLKIKHSGLADTQPQFVDSASVESELALLGAFLTGYEGFSINPYFQKDTPFGLSGLPSVMLVGRIDGPTTAIVKKMIADARAVERGGLWGRVYIDFANLAKQKNEEGYQIGDQWLQRAGQLLLTEGFPVTVDTRFERFATHYPMTDAALYFGWYNMHADGPFGSTSFNFKQGAIACHIHSFSANTIRSETQFWVGPLLAKGAAAVVGNVYEPFLAGSTHLDLFTHRLLGGHTVIEAAYMSTPNLSWMTTVIGDPLYRPFDGLRSFDPAFYNDDKDATFKTLRVGVKRWASQRTELEKNLREAGKLHKTGFYLESLASIARAEAKLDEALTLLAEASEIYLMPIDDLRIGLQRVDIELERGSKERAVAILKELQATDPIARLPQGKSLTAILNQIDPPGPSVTPN